MYYLQNEAINPRLKEVMWLWAAAARVMKAWTSWTSCVCAHPQKGKVFPLYPPRPSPVDLQRRDAANPTTDSYICLLLDLRKTVSSFQCFHHRNLSRKDVLRKFLLVVGSSRGINDLRVKAVGEAHHHRANACGDVISLREAEKGRKWVKVRIESSCKVIFDKQKVRFRTLHILYDRAVMKEERRKDIYK